ncbi:MAG: class I SAM-dependent methyltransferase [Planctomycetota bacterium]|jgi:SAM-dependent methyltransferase
MDRRPLINPTSDTFAQIGRRIFDQREDLQKAYGDAEDLGYQKWLAVHGGLEYPDELAGLYPPIPPAELRHTACGGPTVQTHLYTSLEDFLAVVELWETYAQRPITAVESVLDFGSGCGRLLRRFPMGLPDVACHGADVRAAAVDWCRANLPGTYLHNDTRPPLDLPTDSMDLVISLSVFSHLKRESNLAWIAELSRVTKPDGLLIVSTHGAFALHVICNSAEHQNTLRVTADQARDYLRSLQEQRFIFHPISKEWAKSLDGVEEDYGQVFFNEQFVLADWAPHVQVAGYIPASLSLFQDFHVLKPVKG